MGIGEVCSYSLADSNSYGQLTCRYLYHPCTEAPCPDAPAPNTLLENVVDGEKALNDIIFVDDWTVGDFVIEKLYSDIHDQ